MALLYGSSYQIPGTSPGALIAPADQPAGEAVLTLTRFDSSKVEEAVHVTPEDCRAWLAQAAEAAARVPEAEAPASKHANRAIFWLHISGTPDADLARRLQDSLGLHPLALEDVLNGGQRPKVELYDEHLFVVMTHVDYSGVDLRLYQTSLFLKGNLVISIDAGDDGLFLPVRERLTRGGRLRQLGPDYLLYALIDLIVDHKFPLLERMGSEIEDLETDLLEDPPADANRRLLRMKRHLLLLRRQQWPEREVLNLLLRGDKEMGIGKKTLPYLRDSYDHTVQLMDLLETYREVVTELQNALMLATSNRLNDIIRVLAVISVIFMPLTFIVGVYGMNFDPAAGWLNMPELGWAYGYPAVMIVMLGLTVGMLWFFRKRGWL
ncbi:magnesium/cobalt transporter CorA [Oceanibaculum indicum]|uniref:Magnesium transport protein CorA n=1 Tax=Oceanibaculum indicum P24 TaxID=1207063 RepID=K2IXW1_9PROT|nr:magnesium/cobalt transporter CorA [Oceanibaculum indicum]EKE75301.1 magnesium and cobalt transporter CorA [Oceanibaculum indicum P24]